MSFVSSVNSALIHTDYPLGAVGAIITPAILTVAVATGVVNPVIAPTLLPQGRWAITGTVNVDATTGAATLTGGATGTTIAKNTVVFWRATNTTAVADNIAVPLSAVVDSDGTAVIAVSMTYAVSAGNYQASAAPLSLVQFIRVA
jgi:hypothetical protein